MAGEAATMEERAFSTDALQHIDPLTTEVTLLTVSHRHTSTRFRLRLRLRSRLRLRCRSRSRCRTGLRGHRRHHRLREKVMVRQELNSVEQHWPKKEEKN